MSLTLLGLGPTASQLQAVPVPAPSEVVDPVDQADLADPTGCVIAPYAACAEADLSGRDLQGANLTGANLIRATLDRANVSGATLSRADLVSATAGGATFDGATMAGTDLTHAVLTQASLQRANAPGLDASRANLSGANLSDSDLTGAHFTDANLSGANLSGANLTNAVLHGANLRGASLAGVTLAGADLTGAIWADGRQCLAGSVGECVYGDPVEPEDPTTCRIAPYAACEGANLVNRTLRGVDLTGANLTNAVADGVDLADATLALVDAIGASFGKATLDRAAAGNANFTSAILVDASAQELVAPGLDATWSTLTRVDFSDSDLTEGAFGGANASGANFARATLAGADLSATVLRKADLRSADLSNAVLRRADLTGATIAGANLAGADLSGATWVDGRVCADGSIGSCVRMVAGPVAAWQKWQGRDWLDWTNQGIGAVGLASTIVGWIQFGYSCNANLKATGDCFNPGDPYAAKFDQIQKDLAALKEAVAELTRKTEAGFNEVIRNQKVASVQREWEVVRDIFNDNQIISRKRLEYLACLQHVEDRAKGKSLAAATPCELSDAFGNPRDVMDPVSVDDLYAGSGITPGEDVTVRRPDGTMWAPTDDMQRSGPVARYLHAVLCGFRERCDTDYARVVQRKAERLVRAMAGDSLDPGGVRNGLLYALVDLRLTEIKQTQTGDADVRLPVMLTGDQALGLNDTVGRLILDEVDFFLNSGFALGLLARPKDVATVTTKHPVIEDLDRLVKLGLNSKGGKPTMYALGSQIENYTVPDLYGIGLEGSGPTESVGLVIGRDRKVYRIQQEAGPTTSFAYPGFRTPTYAQVRAVAEAIRDGGVKVTNLQARSEYRAVISSGSVPGEDLKSGPGPVWWAAYGDSFKQGLLYQDILYNWGGSVTGTVSAWFYAPAGTGGTAVLTREADSWNYPCRTPVRMWDRTPDFEESFKADRWNRHQQTKRPNQDFFARTSPSTVNAEAAYNTVVSGSVVVPVFSISRSARMGHGDRWEWGTDVGGTGLFFRCNGVRNDYKDTARAVASSYVTIAEKPAEGAIATFWFPTAR